MHSQKKYPERLISPAETESEIVSPFLDSEIFSDTKFIDSENLKTPYEAFQQNSPFLNVFENVELDLGMSETPELEGYLNDVDEELDDDKVYYGDENFVDALAEEADEFLDEDEYEKHEDYHDNENILEELEENDEFLEESDIADTLVEKTEEFHEEDEHDVYLNDEGFNEEMEGEGEGFEYERPTDKFENLSDESIEGRAEVESDPNGVLGYTEDAEFEKDEFESKEGFDFEPEGETWWEAESEESYDDKLRAETLLDYQAGNKEPIPIPVNRPVPFASPPPFGSYWPLITTHRRGKEVAFQYQANPSRYLGNRSRSFLASRANGSRYHVGIDLYANHKDKVLACEDGIIINFYHFYRSTYALIVEHENVVINYGEVHKDSLKANGLKKGDRVNAGQIIGFAGKMYKSSMLHFEVYKNGTIRNHRWLKRNSAPYNLLNPTKYLLFLKEHGKIANSSISNNQPGSPVTTTPSINIRRAIYVNNRYSKKYGWGKYRDKINDLLGVVTYGNDSAFAEAVADWQKKQGFIGKDVDGIIGQNTWRKMKVNLDLSSYSNNTDTSVDIGTENVETIPDSLGVLALDNSFPELSKSIPNYKFTKHDARWMARFVTGESGVKNDANGHAVLWAMFNRFGILRHRVKAWKSFHNFLILYSTTLQPILRSKGAAQRVWRNHKKNPGKFPIVKGVGTYKGTNMQKVQYKKHIDLQKKKWEEIDPAIRNMVINILRGNIPNPGIGIATEFASTRVYFKQKYGHYPKSAEQWRKYTIDYAKRRCKQKMKGCTWIGDKRNLNQMKNAFFIDNRFKNVPPEAISIVP